jgi:uncharacterized membrane protein YdjX (TVP38/TMEM64 family)
MTVAAPPTPRRAVRAGAAVGLVVVLVAVALFVAPVHEAVGHAAHGDTAALKEQLRGAGVGGVVLLYALMLSHIVLPFPAEVTNLVAGFTYGIPAAMAICMSGWLLSAIGTYALGRYAGRPLLERLTGPERLRAAEDLIERGGWPMLIAARLLPIVPYSPVGYVAGATGVPFVRFVWTTLVGSIPLIAIMVALGSRLEHFSATDPLIWALITPFVLLVAAAHPLGRRLQRAHGDGRR